MIVIGLTGFAGAGKSTVANYLVEQHGFTRLSFAGPLKKMLRTLNPVLDHNIMGNVRLSDLVEARGWDEGQIKDSTYGKEYRRLLQVLGTDCIRAVDPEFWVKAATRQITQEHGKYVFDDVRFPNEAEVIKSYNDAGLWNIHRDGYGAVNGHASEQHAGNMGEIFKFWNSDLADLYVQIDDALELAFKGAAA